MRRGVDVLTSWVASGMRLGLGLRASAIGPRPVEPLELFEFEACPFCRRVREALTMLDLTVLVRPCPKRGPTHRPRIAAQAGARRFPFLRDPNTGRSMGETSTIIAYLFEHYGDRPAPRWLTSGIGMPLSAAASGVRLPRGLVYRPARRPEQPLELFAFEASPYCRLVRETLCELELSYLAHTVGKRSPSRPAFVARSGRMQVPWLSDPNTGTQMFESAQICAYLKETYALSPNE